MSKKHKTYESDCGHFFLTPAAGIRLNTKAFTKMKSSNREISDFISKLALVDEFTQTTKFFDHIVDKNKSKDFILEFIETYKKENPVDHIYIEKKPINLIVSKIVKENLIRGYRA